jgi:hypothetical protein
MCKRFAHIVDQRVGQIVQREPPQVVALVGLAVVRFSHKTARLKEEVDPFVLGTLAVHDVDDGQIVRTQG